jgi:hypothetical protein
MHGTVDVCLTVDVVVGVGAVGAVVVGDDPVLRMPFGIPGHHKKRGWPRALLYPLVLAVAGARGDQCSRWPVLAVTGARGDPCSR